MNGKVASFLLTLALIAWKVVDIIQGRRGVLTWVLLGVFIIGGFFELCELFDTGDQKKTDGSSGTEQTA